VNRTEHTSLRPGQFNCQLIFYRETAAISISKYLIEENATVHIYDPKVTEEQILIELTNPQLSLSINDIKKRVIIEKDPYVACHQSHAIVVCTEWDEFKVCDCCRLALRIKISIRIFKKKGLRL
jgi:UDP-glucose 6-dehydrogenase